MDIDATTYNLNATSSNLVTVTGGGVGSSTLTDPSVTSPSSPSVTDPTEPEEEDPIEVVLPQIEHSDPKSSTVGGDEDGEPATAR